MTHGHDHIFLGPNHAQSERNVWAVIALTVVMMVVEIAGGAMFGSIALVADGFHMSTHAGALLLAALAYTLARSRAGDAAFTFGTGKFGDLAGYSSALILAVVALGIGYESAARLIAPTPIDFAEAIPIAALGLVVNVASAILLSRGGHHHHGHGDHDHHHHGEEVRRLEIGGAVHELQIQEEGVPPRFRLIPGAAGCGVTVETVRPGGARQLFAMIDRGGFLESKDEIPEPHAFEAIVRAGGASAECRFAEPDANDAMHRDHNMRAAFLHVVADAAVSAFVIVGLTLAKMLGWLWMDPLAGLVGAAVIASWSYQLIRDTARVLLDMNPDPRLCETLRGLIEREGDELADLHLWRLGPGHLGAILLVATSTNRDAEHYRRLALSLSPFSHLTIEIVHQPVEPRGARLAA